MTPTQYYRWLKTNWAKVGPVLAVYLFIFLFVFVRPTDFVAFLILLQTPLYMLHETEEYVFPGGFAKFFNRDIFGVPHDDEPMDEDFIFRVNIGVVWFLLPLFGLLSTISHSYGLWVVYFSFFAGVAHIALGIKARRRYNPGLIISLTLNIPVSAWMVMYLYGEGLVSHPVWNWHALIGLTGNLLLPVMGVLLLRQYRRQQAEMAG